MVMMKAPRYCHKGVLTGHRQGDRGTWAKYEHVVPEYTDLAVRTILDVY